MAAGQLWVNLGLRSAAFDKGLRKSRGQIKTFSSTVKSMARSMLAIAGVGGGIYMLNRGIRSVIEAAQTQEQAEADLAAALSKTEGVRKGTISTLHKHAAALQKATIYGDEEILSQLAYAHNLGVTADQLDEAATAAVGLAAKYKLELNTAMMLIGRASKGQTQMLTRYGITLDATLSPQDKFNQLLRIGAANFHLAEAAARTSSGKLKQYENAMGDLKEEIGTGVLPVLVSVAETMTKMVNDPGWRTFFKTQTEGWREIFGGFENLEMVLRGTVEARKSAAELGGVGSGGMTAGLGITGATEKQWSGSAGYTPKSRMGLQTGRQIPSLKIRSSVSQADINRERSQQAFELERQRFFDAQLQQESLDAHNERLRQFKQVQEAAKELAEANARAAEATARKWEAVSHSMEYSMTSAFDAMIWEAEKWQDALTSIARDISREMMRVFVLQPFTQGFMGMFGKQTTPAPAATPMFQYMPEAASGGSVLKTGLAVIHKGEEYSGVNGEYGGGPPKLTINNLGPPIDVEAEYTQTRELVLSIVHQNRVGGGILRGS